MDYSKQNSAHTTLTMTASRGEEESMVGGSHSGSASISNSTGSGGSKAAVPTGSNDSSSSNVTPTSTTSGGGNKLNQLPRRDRWVFRLRVTVIVVLLLAGAATCAVVYLSLRASETSEFETRFQDQSAHVGHALHAELNSKMSAMDNLAITIQSYANSRDIGWPKVTLPEFAYRATSILTIGRGLSVALHPLVNTHNRQEWEEYSVENQQWRASGLLFQSLFPDALGGGEGHGDMMMGHRLLQHDDGMDHGMDHEMDSTAAGMSAHESLMEGLQHDMDMSGVRNISEAIFQIQDGVPVYAQGDIFLPLWQHAEVHTGFPWVNFDIYSDAMNRGAIEAVIKTNQSVIENYFNLEDGDGG
jgi:hypothetical protein